MHKPRTCPSCNKKNFTDNPRCSFCGELLDLPQPPAPAPPIPPPPIPSFTPSTGSAPLAPIPIPTSPGGTPVPYATSSPPSPMSPSASPPLTPLPSDLVDKYGTPDLQGEVVDTRDISVKEREFGAGGWLQGLFGCVMLPFQPIAALFALSGLANRPKETKTIITFRVRCLDGTICQARVERDLAGATVDIGDFISVWGALRNGVLIVKHAYNHTVGGEIILRR